jgi:hypothetical protein
VHRELLARVGGQEPLGLGVVALEHLGVWSRARRRVLRKPRHFVREK